MLVTLPPSPDNCKASEQQKLFVSVVLHSMDTVPQERSKWDSRLKYKTETNDTIYYSLHQQMCYYTSVACAWGLSIVLIKNEATNTVPCGKQLAKTL